MRPWECIIICKRWEKVIVRMTVKRDPRMKYAHQAQRKTSPDHSSDSQSRHIEGCSLKNASCHRTVFLA